MERRVVYADGEIRRDVNVTLDEETYNKMAAGYICCRCYGHVPHAFPEACGLPGCDGYKDGFPMKERQREVMEKEFDGYEWIGISRETYEREQEALNRPPIWTPKGMK